MRAAFPTCADLLGRLEGRLVRLENDIVLPVRVIYAEVIVVRARHDLPTEWSGTLHRGTHIYKKAGEFLEERCVLSITAERALKFVEDTVVLIQVAQLSAQVIVNLDCPNRSRVHVDIPDLE